MIQTYNQITKDLSEGKFSKIYLLMGEETFFIKKISSFFEKNFKIDHIKLSTKFLKIKDVIELLRVYRNSTELLILNKIIKEGSIIADINLNFDESGKIKNDYVINGIVKDTKLNPIIEVGDIEGFPGQETVLFAKQYKRKAQTPKTYKDWHSMLTNSYNKETKEHEMNIQDLIDKGEILTKKKND